MLLLLVVHAVGALWMRGTAAVIGALILGTGDVENLCLQSASRTLEC